MTFSCLPVSLAVCQQAQLMLSSPNICLNATSLLKLFVFYFQEVRDLSSKNLIKLFKTSLCCVFWFAVAFAHTTDKVVLCLHLHFLQFALIQTESEHKSRVHTTVNLANPGTVICSVMMLSKMLFFSFYCSVSSPPLLSTNKQPQLLLPLCKLEGSAV